MSEVKTAPIKEFCLGIWDGPHATPPEVEEGPVFLGIKNVTPEGRLDLSQVRHISEQDYPKWIRRVKPERGDIVFSYEATLHRYALIPENLRCCLGRRMALVRPDPDQVIPQYLYYYFLSPVWRSIVESSVISGATVDRIPIAKFPDFEADIPSIEKQERIVEVLSPYDELIENNDRRIALLEEAVHLLYREWFVNLRFPGCGGDGDAIDDGIPEGWERMPFKDALILQRGFDLPKKDRKPGVVPIYASTGINGFHDTAKVKGPGVVTGRSGTLGTVMYVHQNFWPLNTALWVKEFKRVTVLYAYFLLSNIDLQNYKGGAAVPTLNRNSIHAVEILVPDQQLQAKFDEVAQPIMDQIRLLIRYNEQLREARDGLLPRLMNGSIAV